MPRRGEGERKPTGAAPEIEHAGGRGLADDRNEEVILARPDARGVVDLDEPRMPKLPMPHTHDCRCAAWTARECF